MMPCTDCCCATNQWLIIITLLMSVAAVVLSTAQFLSEKPSLSSCLKKDDSEEVSASNYNSHRE